MWLEKSRKDGEWSGGNEGAVSCRFFFFGEGGGCLVAERKKEK